MSIDSKLRGLERDAERGEKLRDKIAKKLNGLNRDLSSEISEMVRVMFTSDKQFERSLKKRLDSAAQSNKEYIFTQGGQKYKIGDIDAKRVIAQRELTGYEKGKLRKVADILDEIETHAKASVGAARRERVLLNEFEREAKDAARELRSDARNLEDPDDQDEMENDVKEFEERATRIKAAADALEKVQTEAVKLMNSANKARRLIKDVANRRDFEDILTAASGGFGVSAAIAALVGAMGAAGILALPALVAFAISRVVKIVNDIQGKD